MASAEYLRYLNQGATRNLPLSPQLTSALGFLPELGVTAEVFSGGQPEKGSGGARVGSVRHDHGDAADVFFVKDGRRLDWANPEDRPLFEEIVQRGKASGLTGFGAGPGYMQAGSMHVGFGSPGVWGAGGKSATAPDWLVAAYGGAPAPSQAPDTSGDTTLAGGAGNDTLATGDYMPPNNPGGLGGLGGFINSGSGGDLLQAIGASLMGSPSNAPLAGVGAAMTDARQLRMKQEALDQDRAEKQAQQQALELALRSQGFTAEQAAAYAVSPSAANVAVDGRNQQMKLGMAREAQARENSFLSGIAGAAGGADPYAPTAEVIPDVVAEPSPLVAPVSGSPAAPAMSKTAALNQSFKAADDVIASEGFKDASAPKPVNFATGNATVDQLMAKRAKLAALLVTAPSDDAFQRGKLALDQIDKQVEQYAPTGSMKEYTFAMRQRQDAGEPIVKFEAWDQGQRKASATTVSTGEGDKFYENLDRKNAERFATLSDGGQEARSRIGQLGQLETLLKESPSGLEARVKLLAGDYGVNTDGLDGLQATRALIEKMVPAQREPGSGPLSDRDIEGFRRSLPSVINQPGGNALILGAAKAIADYDIQRGEIADRVADRDISPAEGRKQLRELKNPLEGYSDLIGTLGKNGQRGGELAPDTGSGNGVVTAGSSTPAPVRLKDPSDYSKLPSGTIFIAPDGSKRKKP